MRPTIFTEELADIICEELIEGKSLAAICNNSLLPTKSTVMLWLKKGRDGDERYKAFSDQYLRARELQSDVIEDEILDIADDSSKDTYTDGDGNKRVDNEAIQRSKLRVDARFRMLERRRPKAQKVELTGKDGKPIETRSVEPTAEDIRQKLAELGLPTEIYEK